MPKSFIENFFEGMNEKIYFLLVVLTQLVFVFQGLDFADSGFTTVFYQRIFSDPNTVQYNFMYWLTGIIGGLWLKLFPGAGLLGLRIASVICTTITFGITYNLLKKYLQTASLRLGLYLIILFLGTAIRELNYDDITALFFMSAAWFLFSGLTREKYFLLFIAGAFIAANMFARLPNVLGLALMLAIWFSGYLNGLPIKRIAGQSLLFMGGFAVMSIFLFLVMKGLHHDSIFFNSLKLVRQIGGNQENSHGLYQMIKQYFVHYSMGFIISVVVIVGLWSFAAAWRRLKTDVPALRPILPFLKYILLILLTLVCVYRAWKDADFWFYLFLFYAGTSLIVGFLIITGRQPKDMRTLTAIGCIILLVMPVGSNFVLMTVGKYAVWIMIPITIDYLLNIRSLSSSVVVSENRRYTYEQVINVDQMTSLRNGFIFLTLTYILSVTYFYPYFDRSSRLKMRFEVNNEQISNIYTTPERARVINELLAESAKYVKPDDYVLGYDCIPMYYFLTRSRPFMHNSWLWLYDEGVFKEELNKSLEETHNCPVVIVQKGSTIGNNWPENNKDKYPLNEKTLEYLHQFLKEYQYRQVWGNDFFLMYVPAVKNLPVSAHPNL